MQVSDKISIDVSRDVAGQLYEKVDNPKTLIFSCRLAIISALSNDTSRIKGLPLPPALMPPFHYSYALPVLSGSIVFI